MGRHKQSSDEELLAVAREVFVEQGLAASTRTIARRAGVSEAVFYQRYGTKADLFFRAMVPPTLDLEAILDAPRDAPGDAPRDPASGARETLERVALGLLAYFRELFPILMPMLSVPGFDFQDFLRRHPEAPLSRLQGGLIAILEAMQARGEVGGGPVAPAAMMLLTSLHSVALFERLGAHGGALDDATIRAMIDALWRGLAPRAADTETAE
ncbi:MAG: helix-turn-helix domain-containing protein [Nannocystaceae bacterium]